MADGTTRIDKWLWHARVTKTRSLAQKLIVGGKVRVNRIRVTQPSRHVQVGDALTIALPRGILVYRIAAIGTRRGPFAEARELYEDLSPPDAPEVPVARDPSSGTPRPDKRQRRALAALRGKLDC